MKGWYLVPDEAIPPMEGEAPESGPMYRDKAATFWSVTDEVFGEWRYYVVLYYAHEVTHHELVQMPHAEPLTEEEVAGAVSNILGREVSFSEVSEMAEKPDGERREREGNYVPRRFET